ncbi:MAG: SAF domain-containing protein [Pirellulales bacterium]
MAAPTSTTPAPGRHRPRSLTVFAAAFIAGAAAAVGVNRVLDVQLAQRKPQVECEPIFVALRSLPQGTPVTVWDVALKDWPKAMLPATALRATDSFEGCVLRHAIREGQPILGVQLVRAEPGTGHGPATVAGEAFIAPVPAAPPVERQATTQPDLWTPAETVTPPAASDVAATHPAAPTTPPTEAVQETAEPEDSTPNGAGASTEETATAEVNAEPAAAASTLASQLPVAPSPVDIDPPAAEQPTLAAVPQAASETTEAVATDVSTMPSVMKQDDVRDAVTPAQPSQGARYLVVPERIALQADTSFTSPRPTPTHSASHPQPPNPPAASQATAAPSAQVRQASKPSPAARSSQQQQQQTQAQTRRGGQRPVAPQARSPQRSATPQVKGQPQSATPPAQPLWGGLFPNVSAGIDAMGASWQRMRTGEQPTGDARSR